MQYQKGIWIDLPVRLLEQQGMSGKVVCPPEDSEDCLFYFLNVQLSSGETLNPQVGGI